MLDGADLSGSRLINSILYRVKARGTNFRDANLTSAVIELAEFIPKGAVEDDGLVDDIGKLPPWSEYYAEVGLQNTNVRNCNDGIDNDGDGLIDADDLGCRLGRASSEAKSGCVGVGGNSAECRCRTRFDGANFNGANLIGTRFDGADLTGSTLLGAITGKSLEFPLRASEACNQAQVEHCVDFCFEQGGDFFENTDICADESTRDFESQTCLGNWSADCRAKTSEFNLSMDTLSCFYGHS